MLGWRHKILYQLFRPRAPRLPGVEASIAEVDRQNGVFGRNAIVSFVQHRPLGRASLSVDSGKLSGYFEPLARPLAPDFRFEFSEDHEGSIDISVVGDNRYEGFHLSGSLTSPAAIDPKSLSGNIKRDYKVFGA